MDALTKTALSLPVNTLYSRTGAPEQDAGTFWETLQEALGSVNRLQREADQASLDLVSGNLDNLHQVMIKTEEAQLALQLTVQVVNKVIQAYQDISRMQI